MWVHVAPPEKERKKAFLFLVQFNSFGRQFSVSDIVIIIGPLLKPNPDRSFFPHFEKKLFIRSRVTRCGVVFVPFCRLSWRHASWKSSEFAGTHSVAGIFGISDWSGHIGRDTRGIVNDSVPQVSRMSLSYTYSCIMGAQLRIQINCISLVYTWNVWR